MRIKNYHIHVDENIDREEQIIPSMILQPIVENAVNHGLFHKNENGTIVVSFEALVSNGIKVTVEDDGIGINRSMEMNRKSIRNNKSTSSTVSQQRFELWKQNKNWNIDYSIVDKGTIGKGTGTLVTLIFNQPEHL
ncbi:MAG: hypothetical protein HKN48_02490 [Flavobacteriaceae bacterium]|nr:hypothetical protein [Flavobacteriaceae bacterium]